MPPNPVSGGPTEADLALLVESTRGLQPWRRLFHAANGLLMAAALTWVVPSRPMALAALSLVLLALLLLDFVRLRDPRTNALFFRVFKPLVSPREAQKTASSTWYVVGILTALILFPVPVVIPGILVLALADPAASVLGRLWGRHRLGKGSVEGTAIFSVVAFLVLLPFVPPPAAALGAMLTALVEILPLGLDDNLTIPLTVSALVFLLG